MKLNRMNILILTSALVLALQPAYAQFAGDPLTLNDSTPTFDQINLEAITPMPLVLARTSGEDREPKVAVLNDNKTIVFWVNRNGSHHFSGADGAGNQLLPTFTVDTDIDVIVGENTGSNTNWTLCKPDYAGGGFMIAATYLGGSVTNINSWLPDTVMDVDGQRLDDGQGHGLFKIYHANLQPVTPDPVSISQFSAGHREWDCCWLRDGKLVIAAVNRDHPYAADPDFPAGGNQTASINIFNPDGSRFKDEMFIGDLVGQQQDIRLGTLANGFVCLYIDNKTNAGGPNINKGIIYNNNGDVVREFIATDETTGISVAWMDAGGSNTFVTVHQVNGPDSLGLPPELVGQGIIMAQLWSDQGDRLNRYIVASQHQDFRGLGRPRCAMAPNGSFAFSWEDALADTVDFKRSVVGRIFNADGSPATDAFVAHPLPEFTVPGSDPPVSTGGGDPGEPIVGLNNERVAFTWGSRAVPDGLARDNVLMVFRNPAQGSDVSHWDLY